MGDLGNHAWVRASAHSRLLAAQPQFWVDPAPAARFEPIPPIQRRMLSNWTV